MSNFFESGYEVPTESKYFRFEEGDNTFRILGTFSDGKAIMGTEYWKTIDGKRKPIRLAMGISVPTSELEVSSQTGQLELPKHFWALPVYNVEANKVQILEITQKTVMSAIKGLTDNPKWGNPLEYNIVVSKVKENGKISYTVMPEPKEKVDASIVKEYEDMQIDINALYRGEDPFAASREASGEQIAEDAAKALK